ncbi:uncharacterized protein HaLaN_10087 [Haematococcus lacustris]|uniref:Uncharacterized protein n=1 Tax=Haematococcus lacustris TaxID=44745 RepID=A0A699Z4W9_HAELA|nr:uncharacterized protein HaLaN_10087 [Haematococcus lacustris]
MRDLKENVLLLCLGGVRAIVTAEKALLFEPASAASQRFMDTIVPHLEAKADQHNNHQDRRTGLRAPPFELEVLEGALIVATGYGVNAAAHCYGGSAGHKFMGT